MITSLMEMPRVTKNWTHGHNCSIISVTFENLVGDAIKRCYFVIIFILKKPFLKKGPDIIEIVTMSLNQFLKTQKAVKRIRNYVPKCNLDLHFLI